MLFRATILFTLFLVPAAHAAIQCSPTTPIGSQARTKMKHRAAASGAAAPTTVNEMLTTWSLPASLNLPSVRSSNAPIDPREQNKAFTLSGDLWRIKVEDNDCDFHLELTATGGSSTDPRVIVEIPQEFAAARKTVIAAVKAAGQGDLDAHPQLDLSKSVPITVTGLAFFDATHWSKKNPQKGSGHGTQFVGTLWELHPVYAATMSGTQSGGQGVLPTNAAIPHPDHIVVVIEENKGFTDVIGSASAPYINTTLAPMGAVLTKSYGLHHPSQPNYLELFSGDTQGVCNDSCPGTFTGANLAASILANADHHRNTFVGYAENFDPKCQETPTAGQYAQKHCPWRDFTGLPAAVSQDFSKFPSDFTKLPAVAFVIPNLFNDMHSADPNAPATKKAPHPGGKLSHKVETALEVAQGDAWLRDHLDAYAKWAMTHNSLLIVTWDEDDGKYTYPQQCPQQMITTDPSKKENHIATIVVGAHVVAGQSGAMTVTHHNLLRTILDMEGLSAFGGSSNAKPISGIWQ